LNNRRSPFLVNFRRHPNIYGEGKESTQKVQKIDEFIQKILNALEILTLWISTSMKPIYEDME